MMLFILILFFILIKVSPFINNSHLKFKFQRYLSNKDRDFYEKIIQSKDETIKILLSSKDEAIKSKDEAIKILLSRKDEAIESKNEAIKSKDEAIKSKDEAIKILLSSKDEAIKSKDELSSRDGEHIKLLKSNLAVKNAVIYDLQGRLSLRSVIEDFENNSIKEYNEAGEGEGRELGM